MNSIKPTAWGTFPPLKKHTWILMIAATAVLAVFASVSTGYAEASGYGVIGTGQKIELFGGAAELTLKEGYEFLDSTAYYKWEGYDENEIPVYEDYDFGYIIDIYEDSYVFLNFEKSGHIKVSDISDDEILNHYRSYYDYTNVDFYAMPEYRNDKLTWCLDIDDEGESYLAWYELIFTREGYMGINFLSDVWDDELIRYIEETVTIQTGNRYDDFNAGTDSVCGYDFMRGYFNEWSDEPNISRNNTVYSNSSVRETIVALGTLLFFGVAHVRLRKIKQTRAQKQAGATQSANHTAPNHRTAASSSQGVKVMKVTEDAVAKMKVRISKDYPAPKTYNRTGELDGKAHYKKLREEEDRHARRYD